MSVRNILDGTIKVGGDGSGTSKRELFVEELSAGQCYFSNIERCGIIKTTNLIADGSIDMQVGINEPKPLAYITKGDKITVEADNLIAGSSITLGGEEVLKKQYLSDTIKFKGLKADGATAANFSQAIERWMYNIHPKLHILVMSFGVTTEPLSQLIIPTGLTCEKGANCWQRTLLKTNTNEYIDATLVMGEDGGKLTLKLIIPTGSTYTSFQARIATPFY